jgi:hypothetical protein
MKRGVAVLFPVNEELQKQVDACVQHQEEELKNKGHRMGYWSLKKSKDGMLLIATCDTCTLTAQIEITPQGANVSTTLYSENPALLVACPNRFRPGLEGVLS